MVLIVTNTNTMLTMFLNFVIHEFSGNNNVYFFSRMSFKEALFEKNTFGIERFMQKKIFS